MIRYDTWPETIACSTCGIEHDAPTRDEIADSGGQPSTLCMDCERREIFFAILHSRRSRRALVAA